MPTAVTGKVRPPPPPTLPVQLLTITGGMPWAEHDTAGPWAREPRRDRRPARRGSHEAAQGHRTAGVEHVACLIIPVLCPVNESAGQSCPWYKRGACVRVVPLPPRPPLSGDVQVPRARRLYTCTMQVCWMQDWSRERP